MTGRFFTDRLAGAYLLGARFSELKPSGWMGNLPDSVTSGAVMNGFSPWGLNATALSRRSVQSGGEGICSVDRTGSFMVKTVASPIPERTVMTPPCLSTIFLVSMSPIPVPDRPLELKKGLNILDSVTGSIPPQLSVTRNSTPHPSAGSDRRLIILDSLQFSFSTQASNAFNQIQQAAMHRIRITNHRQE